LLQFSLDYITIDILEINKGIYMRYIISITMLILLIGCDQPTVNDKNEVHVVKQTYLPPPPPKKKIKLKEIDDTNYNPTYMYPEDTKKKVKEEPTAVQTPSITTDTMDKQECIAMISQEKFDKYTAMFGSEADSIKRCKMLKATR
jgi:hypothetical protein